MTGCVPEAQPEIHLIPESYRGHVVIHFGSSSGKPPKKEGEFRVYEIGVDGTLETQFSANPGIRPEGTMLFFQVNNQGTRTKIPRFDQDGLAKKDIVVSNLYVMANIYHYFIDELQYIYRYENPALDESERNWQIGDDNTRR